MCVKWVKVQIVAVCGSNGFECAKTTSLKDAIDARVNQMNAKSDNCGGVKNE